MNSRIRTALGVVIGAAFFTYAQDLALETRPDMEAPVFDARISVGFNYDLLRSPTNVPFEYPRGYIGLNIPYQRSVNPLAIWRSYDMTVDSVFADPALFRDGKEFQPVASARQNPNATVRVDVPMLGGVGSFSNIQNFRLTYRNTLGLPGLKAGTSDSSSLSLLLRGVVHVPLEVDMAWETMTFGYAYRVNRNVILALNLHRHVFRIDLSGKVDIDLLGYARIQQAPLDVDIPLDYRLRGSALGSYVAEAWSPTLGMKLWRFGFTSRFGLNTRAHGYLSSDYSIPFFMDNQTFQVNLDPARPGTIDQLKRNEVVRDSVQTDGDMIWKMPSGYTFSFDIVREHLTFSYTKFVGEIAMKLDNVWRIRQTSSDGDVGSSTENPVDLDLGVKVDHIFLLHGEWHNAFFNIGLFTLDFRWADRETILGSTLSRNSPDVSKYLLLGGSPMLPVLSIGSALGSRIQLLLELDILPLLAIKTGVIYHF